MFDHEKSNSIKVGMTSVIVIVASPVDGAAKAGAGDVKPINIIPINSAKIIFFIVTDPFFRSKRLFTTAKQSRAYFKISDVLETSEILVELLLKLLQSSYCISTEIEVDDRAPAIAQSLRVTQSLGSFQRTKRKCPGGFSCFIGDDHIIRGLRR